MKWLLNIVPIDTGTLRTCVLDPDPHDFGRLDLDPGRENDPQKRKNEEMYYYFEMQNVFF